MPRITRHQMFMDMAFTAAKRSTCSRANNGAILVCDNNVVSIGYNGPPSGQPHCLGDQCLNPGRSGCQRSLHAEQNAITRARQPLDGATLYCTMTPCFLLCAPMIVKSGIRRVFYAQPYRDMSSVDYMLQSGVNVFRLTLNGDVIDEATGSILDGDSIRG